MPTAWREALHLFGVTDEEIDENAFPEPENLDPEWAFACLVADAPSGISTDWRGDQVESLQLLADAMEEMDVGLELDFQDISRLEVAVTADGNTRHYVRAMPDEWENFHGLVFALAAVLPACVTVYALLPFDDTDGWGHAVLPMTTWEQVRGLLGPAFDRLFTRHPPSKARFRPSRRHATPTWSEWVGNEAVDRRQWVNDRLTKGWYKESQNKVMLLLERRNDAEHWKREWTASDPKRHRAFLAEVKTAGRLRWTRAHLETIADYRTARGAVQVLEGDPAGWAELHAGVRAFHWLTRIDHWAFTSLPDPSSHLDTHKLAGFLAAALALGERELALWPFRRILTGAWNLSRWSVSQPNGVYPLTLRLCALLDGVPTRDLPSTEALGPYRAVLSAWKNEKKLVAALLSACEHHVRQARRSATDNAFRFFPASAFPAEILAVLQTRRMLGLPVPHIEHPLLDTPLGRPPAVIPTVPDDLLDRLIQAVEEEMPVT